MSREIAIEKAIVPATTDSTSLVRAEIDMQISTAKQFPRSLKRFSQQAMEMVEMVAMQGSTRENQEELFYALPRGGKIIEGPSVRLAEIIQHCYGNCRAGARQVDETATHVVLQGVFHDLETNAAVTIEVKRRITKRDGTRYDDDMVGVTSNAGCGVAYRNAVLKGIPKALWLPLYERARKIAGGSGKPKQVLADAKKAIEFFASKGASVGDVLRLLGVSTPKEITADHIVTLRGVAEAIRSGETSAAAAFGLRAEKANGEVRDAEIVDDRDRPIDVNQVRDVWTMITDAGYDEETLRRLLRKLRHPGEIETLPASRYKKLVGAIGSLESKKKSGRLF